MTLHIYISYALNQLTINTQLGLGLHTAINMCRNKSILQILVMEKCNAWISFYNIEEFFNHLASSIIIVDGLFGYPWHVIDINKIKFTPDMNSIFTKTGDWIF